VAGNGGHGQVEHFRDLTDTEFLIVCQSHDDTQTASICKGFGDTEYLIHGFTLLFSIPLPEEALQAVAWFLPCQEIAF
jgi:hypothetical protein